MHVKPVASQINKYSIIVLCISVKKGYQSVMSNRSDHKPCYSEERKFDSIL